MIESHDEDDDEIGFGLLAQEEVPFERAASVCRPKVGPRVLSRFDEDSSAENYPRLSSYRQLSRARYDYRPDSQRVLES
jgi:hypothetical protein